MKNVIVIENGVQVYPDDIKAEAEVGGVIYDTLSQAISSAAAGSTVKLLKDVDSGASGIGVSKNLTLDLNGKTLVGDSDFLFVYSKFTPILTIVDSSKEGTGTIAADTDASIYIDSGSKVVLESGTIKAGANGFGVLVNDGAFVMNGGKIDAEGEYGIVGFDASIEINDGEIVADRGISGNGVYDDSELTINGGSITATEVGIYHPQEGKLTINGGSITGTVGVYVRGAESVTITGGTITGTGADNDVVVDINRNGPQETGEAITFENNGGEYGEIGTVSITGGRFVSENADAIGSYYGALASAVVGGFISGGAYSSAPAADLFATGLAATQDTNGWYQIVKAALLIEGVSVQFKLSEDNADEGYKVYDIVIVAKDNGIINRLNTADLTFALSNSKVSYAISPAKDITLTRKGDRYMFNFDGKDNVVDTDTAITVGSVKFVGYDAFTFSVADAATNLVTATTAVDNVVDEFKGSGLVINTDLSSELLGTVDTEIKVPTRTLTVNVAFPNAVVDNAANQAMTVTISGGDLAADIVYDLSGKMANGGYTVTADLTKNVAYNVTVSGDGYRTAYYTVTMTDAKTLNFWNNVKDEATVVEIGEASSVATVTYLAGDIVSDNIINIYDLSAVVSYFATKVDYSVKNEYIKYDLNRDGVIDSKDVAYILASWNK